MEVTVSEAKALLTELVRRAEGGEDVVLTRHGRPTVRLTPIFARVDRSARRRIMEAARRTGAEKAVKGAPASRSQDFLYDENGLPR